MEIALVLALLAGAVMLFVTEKFRVDLVSLMVLGALLATGVLGQYAGFVRADKWITLQDGLSGFSNAAVITVAAMFVLSAGLQKTGALAVAGRTLVRMGRNRTVLLLAMMAIVGAVSAFVNNTAAVAVFLPLVLTVCHRRDVLPSRMLIPLSFASQFGGVCTLIGSSTNILVSSISNKAGYGPFSMFEFTSLGSIMLCAGVLYILLVGQWLVPVRRGEELSETYHLREYLTEVRVMPGSPLIGKTVQDSKLGERHDVNVLEILRDKRKIWLPHHDPIQAGDILLVRGKAKSLMELRRGAGLEIEPEFKLKDANIEGQDLTLVEALVAPGSWLAGRTLAETDFRWRYDAIVLALQRQGHLLGEKLAAMRLRFGDALLLLLRKGDLARLRANDNLIVLAEVDEPSLRSRRGLAALAIITVVVALAALGVMPILLSALLGALAMVLTRCLTLEQAYEAIDWKVIFLLAGVLPLGLALERSGAAHLIAGLGLELVGRWGPIAVLAMFYLLTAVLTEFMSNNTAAVLLAPIAISTAKTLGVDPKPLLMAVTFAASTSFATPVGYQTNTMVYSAGGYRFTDFTKVGLPLNLLFWGLAVYFIPKYWPF